MQSLSNLIDRHGVDVLEHLDRDELVPVSNGLQAQGDVMIVPTRPSAKPGLPVPAEGVAVVRGENGGNTHLLLADGPVAWAPADVGPTDLVLGTLTVPDDATAWFAHPEHGYVGIAPGAYTIRRQREQADEIRRVAD